jgi:quercetin dioxygenase-like cupin family protein
VTPGKPSLHHGRAIVVDDLASVELGPARPIVYDRDIGMRLLYEDPESGEEHYLVGYPAGLGAGPHRHTAAHTIVVLEGRLEVNDQVVGPGAYCHFPAGEVMRHAPAEGQSCLFVIIFHGPSDVYPVED